MPRGFNERERALIRERLLASGREALGQRGMRKTSVEELTAAAGISKGAFYLFFESKEELFFTVIQEFEAAYQHQLLAEAGLEGRPPRESLRRFLQRAFSVWRSEPLFRHFGREEYEQLLVRLPAGYAAQALQADEHFAAQLLARWSADGLQVDLDPPLLTGLLRALFLISLHADEFDAAVYPRLSDLLIDLIAGRIAATPYPDAASG